MNETKQDRERRRIRALSNANEARSIAESEFFTKARETVLESIYARMRSAPIGDDKLHSKLVLMLQVWHAFEGIFTEAVSTGKMTQMEIDEEVRRREAMENAGEGLTRGRFPGA
jgi:hypothetical protein